MEKADGGDEAEGSHAIDAISQWAFLGKKPLLELYLPSRCLPFISSSEDLNDDCDLHERHETVSWYHLTGPSDILCFRTARPQEDATRDLPLYKPFPCHPFRQKPHKR